MTQIPNIGKPAASALEHIGITQLEELTQFDEKNLLKLHGLGPKAAGILKDALQTSGLKFKEEEQLTYSPEFLISGSLGCNNAPKREVIRDFLILAYMNDKKAEALLVTEMLLPKLPSQITALHIYNILTHGKEGAANGTVITADGQTHHWAYFIEFENHKKDARIKNISSYSKSVCDS